MRRIEAVTGPAASELLRRNDRAAEAAAKAARTTVEQLPEVVAELQARVRELEKAAKKGGGGATSGGVDVQALAAGAVSSGEFHVLATEAPSGTDADALLALADRLKGSLGPSAVVLGASDAAGAVQFVATLSPEAVAHGLNAATAVRAAAAVVGGGGGGRPSMARAGGNDASRLGEALDAARSGPARRRLAPVKVLALDYGSARTGVAVSDPSGTLARPLTTVRRAAARAGLAELSAIIERERPGLIVVGLPLTLAGKKGPQAAETASFVGRLRERCQVPIVMEDERFTTKIGRELAPGHPGGDDVVAATVLLQGYLDARARGGSLNRRGRRVLGVLLLLVLLGVGAVGVVAIAHLFSGGSATSSEPPPPTPVRTVKLLVPEGYAIRDIVAKVPTIGLSKKSYRAAVAAAHPPAGYRATGKEKLGMEGFLFPATYDLVRPVSGTVLVAEQLHAFQREPPASTSATRRSTG